MACILAGLFTRSVPALLILSALASPYLHDYDLLGTSLAVALLVEQRLAEGRFGIGEPLIFFLAWFGPGLLPWQPAYAHLVPLLLLLLLASAWRRGGVRAMRLLSGSARLAGVTGWPVAHSRSPRIHGTWLTRHGIDGAYVPLPIGPADFAAVIPALAKAGFAGVNVTIPHKEAAFAICAKLDEFARRAGAVNTLVFTEHGIEGRNTDGYGFIANLRHHGVNPAAGPVLISGRRRRGTRHRRRPAG